MASQRRRLPGCGSAVNSPLAASRSEKDSASAKPQAATCERCFSNVVAMKTVSRFEANLLRILRSFLQRAPLERALPLVMEPSDRPPCLSRAVVELVQDHLRKGCVWLL